MSLGAVLASRLGQWNPWEKCSSTYRMIVSLGKNYE
jgi:hypothetical protein